jgi:hypothetical protein
MEPTGEREWFLDKLPGWRSAFESDGAGDMNGGFPRPGQRLGLSHQNFQLLSELVNGYSDKL